MSGPYRVEVEQERQVTLKTHCIMGPDGYAHSQFFEDYDDDPEAAQDCCDTLNKGWEVGWLAGVKAGLEAAHEACLSLPDQKRIRAIDPESVKP